MTEQHVYSPISPYLMVHDGQAALEFYARAFGAAARETYPHEGKLGHATLTINGSDVMVSDEFPLEPTGVKSPRTLGGSTCALSLAVDDADVWFARAVAAGAEIVRPLANEFFGRSGRLRDPFGHVWAIVGPAPVSA